MDFKDIHIILVKNKNHNTLISRPFNDLLNGKLKEEWNIETDIVG